MMAFTHSSIRNKKHVLCWLILAFQAGAINAGGFLACHSYVSHVTGFGTMIGIKFASKNFLGALELFAVPISFLAGAIASGVLIDQRRESGKAPAYLTVMASIFLLLLFVLVFGLLGWLGKFGEPFELMGDIVQVSALCLACGLQNASITSATHGTIRTTHLTGILTDLGINLVRLSKVKRFSKEKYRQMVINKIRMGTFIFFSVGSALASLLYLKYEYFGFILPCLTSAILLNVSYVANSRQKTPLKLRHKPLEFQNLETSALSKRRS